DARSQGLRLYARTVPRRRVPQHVAGRSPSRWFRTNSGPPTSSNPLTNQVDGRKIRAPWSCYGSMTTLRGWTPGDGGAETTGARGRPRGRQAHLVLVVVPVHRVGWQPRPVGRHRPRSARPLRRLRRSATVALRHLRGRLRIPIVTPAGRSRAAMPLE